MVKKMANEMMIVGLVFGLAFLIIVLLFIIPLAIMIFGIIKFGMGKTLFKPPNLTEPFNPKDFGRMMKIVEYLDYLLIALIFIFGFPISLSSLFDLDASPLLLGMPYVLLAFYIIVCLEVILVLLEHYRRGTNIFKDLYYDYENVYKANNIPVIGQCKICGRAIPQYYGLKVGLNSDKLLEVPICFQADGQHVVTLQNQEDKKFFNEYQKIFDELNNIRNYWVYGKIIILIYYIVISVIFTELLASNIPIMIGYGPTNSNYYTIYTIAYGVLSMVPLSILFSIQFIDNKITHIFLIKRLYFDNMYEEIKEAIDNGKKIDISYIQPPDYTKQGDQLPSFIETIKMARTMANNIRSATKGVAAVKDVKNIMELASTVKGVGSDIVDTKKDVDDFLGEHTSGKGTSVPINSSQLRKPVVSKLQKEKCPNCGKEIEEEWKKCPFCSKILKKDCPNCGKTLKVNWLSCPFCGFDFNKSKKTKKSQIKQQRAEDKQEEPIIEEQEIEQKPKQSEKLQEETDEIEPKKIEEKEKEVESTKKKEEPIIEEQEIEQKPKQLEKSQEETDEIEPKKIEEKEKEVESTKEKKEPSFRICPNCGNTLKPNQKFCTQCGAKFY
ncbi:MAG: zinc-ribbon domain-containing protein [Promethearchaeota archaeon]|nr:MAG: zinc-ribbon domain-containing protein [Candidatus Lokiarchaeota archaeon]